MNITSLASALVPVLFVLLLGYLAGRKHRFDQDQAAGFSALALNFALPASLFVGMAQIKREVLFQQVPLLLAMLACYGGTYALAYFLARRSRTLGAGGAAIVALLVSFPAAPVYGAAVLQPLFGAPSIATVGIVALICNLTITPLTLVLLAQGEAAGKNAKSPQSAGKDAKSPQNVGKVVLDALASPLVWAPALGLFLSLLGWRPPALFDQTLLLLGSSASGVAIFASGLVLAAHKVQFSREVWAMSAGKLILEPALLLLLLLLFHIHGSLNPSAFVSTALPSAVLAVLLAAKAGKAQASSATTLFVTSLGTIIVLPLTVWISSTMK